MSNPFRYICKPIPYLLKAILGPVPRFVQPPNLLAKHQNNPRKSTCMRLKHLPKRIVAIFLALTALSPLTRAQVSNYTFSQTVLPYTAITGGTIVVAGAATPASDDEVYPGIPIGFSFTYDGSPYTSFGINSNGFIWLGTGEPLPDSYTPISGTPSNLGGTGTVSGIISPLGRDLLKRTVAPFGELRVQTIGTAPNRTCVVQFANWRGFLLGTSAVYNFQIRLQETSNVITFSYGTFDLTAATESSDFEIGLRGIDNADFNNVVASNAGWNNATPGISNTDASTLGPNIFPASGTAFVFTPGQQATCTRPAGLRARYITATSDSVIWNKVNTALRYEWTVNTSATPPASGTATSSNNDTAFLVAGLTPSTTYYLHVRSVCAGNDFSTWSTLPFTTVRINDLCTDATNITSNIGNNIADTVGRSVPVAAGLEGTLGAAFCSTISTGHVNDVWFKFTAPAGTDSLIVTGVGGSSSDWVYQLYNACGGEAIACNDDGENSNPFGDGLMPFMGVCGLQPGATYFIRAYPYTAGTTATCNLYLYSGGSCPTNIPANDNCVNAISISCNTPITGTTVNASASSTPNAVCGSSFATQTDVWYKFNSGASNIVPYIKVSNIDTGTASAPKEIYLALYRGSGCSNLIYQGCLGRDLGSDSIGAYLFGSIANNDYYVRVYSIADVEQTTFSITVCDSTSTTLLVDTTGQSPISDCLNFGNLTISSANQNNNNWVRIINSGLAMEINAQGQNLGSTNFRVTRNISGSIRRDNSRSLPLLGREYMDRNVTITPTTQPNGPVKVRIYFTNAELASLVAAGGDGYADVGSVGDIVITKNQQPCSSFVALGNEVRIPQTGNGTFADGAYVEFETTSFSTFFLHGGAQPLPVNLLSFQAQRSGRVNLLNWATAQEVNLSHFVIERSTDGSRFTEIGRIAGLGNTSGDRQYRFTDAAPVNGYNYYRLRSEDRSGALKYSDIRKVKNTGSASISIFPNPVDQQLTLNISSDKTDRANVSVFDMNGREVFARITPLIIGVNNLNIPAVNLPSGTYIVKIQMGGEVIVEKFSKR